MKYQLANHVSLTEVDDEAVLLDLNSGAYFGLNHVGALFIKHIQLDQSSETAIKQIVQHYGVSASRVESDINQLLEQLTRHKLILKK